MTTKFIQVSPLPPATTTSEIKSIFEAYKLQRVAVSNNKAYIQFSDINEVETLDFTFEDLKVAELQGAEISPIYEDFEWPMEEIQTKVEEKKAAPQKKQKIPQFIVVKDCDLSHLKQCDESFIKEQIFEGYRIGRILKWKSDVFVEFLDQNEIQLLENKFKDQFVLELGPVAKIDLADENFNFDLIYEQVKKHKEAERLKREQEQMKRLEQIERKKKELQDIQKKRQEKQRQERLKKMEEDERLSRLAQRQVPTEHNPDWNVRPDEERETNRHSKSKTLGLLWFGIIVLWGCYVILS